MMTPFPQTWVMVGVSYGSSSMMMKTPTEVVVLVEALGVVGLARAAKNQCGGEWGQVQELEDPFLANNRSGAAPYIGISPHLVEGLDTS
jgi:hypothetical protein